MCEGARAGSLQYNRRENEVGEGSIDQEIIWRRADRRPALRSNNSSGLAALTELKVKIQAEPESDFLLQHSRKLYGQECYCLLHICSLHMFSCPSALHYIVMEAPAKKLIFVLSYNILCHHFFPSTSWLICLQESADLCCQI